MYLFSLSNETLNQLIWLYLTGFTLEANGTKDSMPISDIYDAELEVNLLFYNKWNNSHYIYITAIEKLASSQLSKPGYKIPARDVWLFFMKATIWKAT